MRPESTHSCSSQIPSPADETCTGWLKSQCQNKMEERQYQYMCCILYAFICSPPRQSTKDNQQLLRNGDLTSSREETLLDYPKQRIHFLKLNNLSLRSFQLSVEGHSNAWEVITKGYCHILSTIDTSGHNILCLQSQQNFHYSLLRQSDMM